MAASGDTVILTAHPWSAPGVAVVSLRVWAIRILACATCALAPIEGYLQLIDGNLSKLPALLLVVAWIGSRWIDRTWPLLHSAHILLAALAVVVLASSALHMSGQFTFMYLIRWLPFLVVTAILIDVCCREVPVRMLLAASILGGAAAAFGALFSLFVLGDSRATGPLEDPNDLAYVLVAALPLLVVFLDKKVSRIRIALIVGVAAVLVLGAAATLSRGGALALMTVIGFLLVRRMISVRALAGVSAVLVGVGAVVTVAAWDVISSAVGEKLFIGSTNADTRIFRWRAAARMLADNPFLGVGPGGFREFYVPASRLAEPDALDPVTHNMYMEVAAELGIAGILCFIALIVLAFVSTERALRAGADRRLVIGCQASLIAVLVASTFLSEEYYFSLWAILAACYAIQIRGDEEGGMT